MGAQDDFSQAQDFLNDTGLTELTMLWEGSGAAWRINNINVNSAMQLFSFDLSKSSTPMFWNNPGRETILSASPDEPWAPPGGGVSQ